jgi:hypothetical protein
MSMNAYARLAQSDGPRRPVAIMAGLWRKGHLRAPDLRERRRDIRIPTNEAVEISVGPTRLEARIVDVSRSGLRLTLNWSLTSATLVTVHLREAEVTAEVRYCCAADGIYHAGLQIV